MIILKSFLSSCLMLVLAGASTVFAQISTQRVEARPAQLTHTSEATLEATTRVTIAAQVQGRIVELWVDAGDTVRRDEVLLRIDATAADQAVSSADAIVAQAQATLANARADYERTRSLLARGFVSPSAVDQARAAFEAADAQLRAARAGRGQASTALGYTTIAATLDGVVAERLAEVGEVAQPGRPLLTIFDPAQMRAVVDVPQFRLAGLVGDALEARVELPAIDRWVDAVQVTVLPAADARTHTVRVRVDLPAGLAGVKPGSFARVHFLTGETLRLAVPVSAVLRRSEITGVYVADGQGGFGLRQVRIGMPQPDGSVEVLAGLVDGEVIALDPIQAGIEARARRAAGR
ncbi:MAG TPA: efflux RND transporter periplasmic adaptor subunit [Rhodocyclaceae bacterium]|nr:efflux RND transporter periplasmic adaptor subunit [Rhodocyclaceae bacterium]